MDQRRDDLQQWLHDELGWEAKLSAASEDASFRRYFRICHGGRHYMVMDAPPQRENNRSFADVADRLCSCGVNVPKVLRADFERGFLLLTDLGSRLYLDELDSDNADTLYGDAIDALLCIQRDADVNGLPLYDRAQLTREMELFREWLVSRYLGLTLDPVTDRTLQRTFDFLARAALEQPRTFVHRDYHSRNLMYVPRANPGILDFQDAVAGPVTYDLVSLLKDCYIDWPPERVQEWLEGYLRQAGPSGRAGDIDVLRRRFDLMGVQRHLKAAGIFARLWLRDGKPGFLADVPRTLRYIAGLRPCPDEIASLAKWIGEVVLPAMQRRLDDNERDRLPPGKNKSYSRKTLTPPHKGV